MNISSLPEEYTKILLNAARDKGIDCATLFTGELGLSFHHQQTRWNNRQLGVISHKLKCILNDDFWGLSKGRVAHGSFRFACEICTLCGTLEEALLRAFRFYELSTDGVSFRLAFSGDDATITMQLPGPLTEGSGLLYEWWLWLWHFISQWMIGMEISLTEVDFPHQPIGLSEDYDATFGAHWRFGQGAAQITFPAASLKRRIIRTLADVEKMHTKITVSLSYSPEVELSAKTLVGTALTAHLKQTGSLPTLERLAIEYGVCSQTLRRRLQREGASYRAIKAEVRTEVARRRISQEGATISDAATSAGFAEPNGLARAIRAWTGLTISEFRRTVADRG